MSERKPKIEQSSLKKKYSYTSTPLFKNQNRGTKLHKKESKALAIKHSLTFSTEEQILKEMDDPNNDYIKDSLTDIINIKRQIKELSKFFADMKTQTQQEAQIISELSAKINTSVKIHYKYVPYLRGLQPFIEEFLGKVTEVNPSTLYQDAPTLKYLETYEKLYHCLGHDSYTNILKIFEKYCLFGKTYTKYTMEYSQFCSLFIQNNLYETTLPKSDMEVIYNRVKKNTDEKNVTFNEFVTILDEIAKHLYPWETNQMNRIKYLIGNKLANLPCIEKTEEDKKRDRWYYLLETDEIKPIFKENVFLLYSWFSKHCDDCKKILDIETFINMVHDKKIIPIFLSNKEVVGIVNYVRYHRKNLAPTNFMDFYIFCDAISILSLHACSKYLEEGGNIQTENSPDMSTSHLTKKANKKYIDNHEKLKLFYNFILFQK